MDLQHLLGADKELSVEFDTGESLTVTYTPAKVTADSLAELRETAVGIVTDEHFAEVAAAETLVSVLATVLVDWDLTNDGEPVGTDVATLRSLPLQVVGYVWAAIQEDMDSPGEGKRGASAGGSARKASGSRTKGGAPRKRGR